MLILRKEIKIGIGAGLTILGIAGVYGLMASLSNSGAEKKDQSAMVSGDAATDDKGLASAQTGLPPKDEPVTPVTPPKLVDGAKSVDPFSESQRTDGNPNNDAVLSALTTGRIGETKMKDSSKTASELTVVRAPTSAKPVSKLVQPAPASGDSTASSDPASKSPDTSAGGTKYVVKPGDTFSTISSKLYGSKKYAASLVKANPDVNPSRMKIGQEITVPAKEQIASVGGAIETDRATLAAPIDATRQYRVVSGDTLSHISQKLYGKSTQWQAIYEANKTLIGPNEAKLKVGMLLDLPQKPVR